LEPEPWRKSHDPSTIRCRCPKEVLRTRELLICEDIRGGGGLADLGIFTVKLHTRHLSTSVTDIGLQCDSRISDNEAIANLLFDWTDTQAETGRLIRGGNNRIRTAKERESRRHQRRRHGGTVHLGEQFIVTGNLPLFKRAVKDTKFA